MSWRERNKENHCNSIVTVTLNRKRHGFVIYDDREKDNQRSRKGDKEKERERERGREKERERERRIWKEIEREILERKEKEKNNQNKYLKRN